MLLHNLGVFAILPNFCRQWTLREICKRIVGICRHMYRICASLFNECCCPRSFIGGETIFKAKFKTIKAHNHWIVSTDYNFDCFHNFTRQTRAVFERSSPTIISFVVATRKKRRKQIAMRRMNFNRVYTGFLHPPSGLCELINHPSQIIFIGDFVRRLFTLCGSCETHQFRHWIVTERRKVWLSLQQRWDQLGSTIGSINTRCLAVMT